MSAESPKIIVAVLDKNKDTMSERSYLLPNGTATRKEVLNDLRLWHIVTQDYPIYELVLCKTVDDFNQLILGETPNTLYCFLPEGYNFLLPNSLYILKTKLALHDKIGGAFSDIAVENQTVYYPSLTYHSDGVYEVPCIVKNGHMRVFDAAKQYPFDDFLKKLAKLCVVYHEATPLFEREINHG